MKIAFVLVTIAFMFLGHGGITHAQQPAKVFKIGYFSAQSDVRGSRGRAHEVVRRELHAKGDIEGQNISFEYRYAGNKLDRLPILADELVGLKVDVLIARSPRPALAAKNATRTIPVVFYDVADPVALGLVDSLARPGGNLTGLTIITEVLVGKRLELLKETVPKLSAVAVLWNPQNPGNALQWKESQRQTRALGLQLHSMEVSSADRYEGAFKETAKAHSAALAVTPDPLVTSNFKLITDLAVKYRLPAIVDREEFVDGLMSYGADQDRHVAWMIDKFSKERSPVKFPSSSPRSLSW